MLRGRLRVSQIPANPNSEWLPTKLTATGIGNVSTVSPNFTTVPTGWYLLVETEALQKGVITHGEHTLVETKPWQVSQKSGNTFFQEGVIILFFLLIFTSCKIFS